jgi:hypothetical protein
LEQAGEDKAIGFSALHAEALGNNGSPPGL